MGRKVNQTELAEIVGVSDVTLWQWQKEGMPIEERNTRGQSNVYDTAVVIAWDKERAIKKVREESPRDALARAQTKLIEQTLAEKAGELVPIAELEPRFAQMIVSARQRLLQIPGLLRGALDESQVGLLEQHLLEALQELARYEQNSQQISQPAGGDVGAADQTGSGGLGGDEALSQRQDTLPGTVPAVDHAIPA